MTACECQEPLQNESQLDAAPPREVEPDEFLQVAVSRQQLQRTIERQGIVALADPTGISRIYVNAAQLDAHRLAR